MNNKFIKISSMICTIISLLLLNGCNSNSSTNIEKENANLKDETSDKSNDGDNNIILVENEKIAAVLSEKEANADLEKALRAKYDLDENSAKQTRYYYNYVDLDGDGTNEIFAEVVGPFTSRSGGDNAIIYKYSNGILEEVEDFSLIRNPVIISEEKTNGWKDIIVESSGGGSEKKYVVLKYDGDEYSDVNESESISSIKDVSGVAIISNDMAKDLEDGNGLYLG